MKKFIILFTLLLTFLFIPNVSALTLGYPSVFYYENGTPYSTNATIDTWGTTEYYVGPNIGRISPAVDINRVDYNWFNAGLCPNKNISIKFRLAGTVGFFSNVNWALSVYNNNQLMTCSFSHIDGSQIDVSCYSDVGGGDLSVYLSTNVNYPDYYHTAISRNFDVSCDVSNEAIVSQSIENTQNIINNQNSNTSTITQNQDINTQNIINNQNSNTQQEIESQKVCKVYDKSSIYTDNMYLNYRGSEISYTDFGITNYINISSNSQLNTYVSTVHQVYYCFYNINKSLISCSLSSQHSVGDSISIPNDASYVRFSINKSTNSPQFKICKNGNTALSDDINNLNDTLNSEQTPNTNQDIQDMENMVASDTPISDLITMPLTLINAYINGINSSCSPYNLGNLYGTNLIFPCINLEQRLGSSLWSIIDALFSIFMCYNIGMLFITAFDGLTSLRDDFEGLYQPRHADTGYQPKHGGGN